MPTEARRMVEAEHQKEMRDSAELKQHRGDDEPERRRPWWKFWDRGR